MASLAPHFFCGKGVYHRTTLLAYSPRAVDYSETEKPIAFCLSSVSKIHLRQLYELLQVAKAVKLTKTGVTYYPLLQVLSLF